ncbi:MULTISPECIES: acyl-CoA dehydrogenase family protein [unclassified Nocardioides]|uniref:acyl-CoA dehydrogenase family protein n=1 Tax=unclassified Nocardioides TaxID=2615069 RepID=UPI0006F3A69B|nr:MULTISPECIES: acyl-CoA dehydrogenase family protein [unclassified Nocardioides]KQY54443.1 acyl-CoA dehydrogenase [Nocardioides sp. Root140]KQZ66317.1 acyl-CoA dehydrogenase [Nocardioides sp. Root151]KRF19518.1 acyl-CoA dehydrogenase [Nocardioides sp. Soil796]
MSDATNLKRADNPRDFLDLDTLIDHEERAIQQTVRSFVVNRVLPEIGDWYDQGVFPRELAKEMGGLGLLGMHLEGYDCAGTNAVSYGLACLELEAGDSGFRSFVSVQGSLAMFPIHAYGSEEQKEAWLPGMAAGEIIGCFGLTEPDSGSDPGSMKTQARRDGTDWVLNGTKMWITNAPIADVAVIWARTDDGIRGFIVPTGTPGFTVNTIHKKASLRASVTGEIVLEDVRLPQTAVLPGVTGLRGPLSCLNEARFGILFGAVGAGRACYEAALDYSLSREQFGKPIAGFQLVQRKLVEMLVSVNRSTLVALHLGRLKDAGTLTPAQVSFGKLDNVRQAMDVAREARNSLGANGITLEYPVIRHMNNLESVYTYEGTNEIHTLALGHAITGTAAYR